MTDTWAVDDNGTGQRSSQNCCFCIENIQRIENPRVFCQYQARASSVAAEGEGVVFVSPEPPIRSRDGDLERYAQLRKTINECYMWHRAEAELLDSICQNGLDSLVSTEGAFGTGTYFSDKSSKSYHRTTGQKIEFFRLGGSCRQYRSRQYRNRQ